MDMMDLFHDDKRDSWESEKPLKYFCRFFKPNGLAAHIKGQRWLGNIISRYETTTPFNSPLHPYFIPLHPFWLFFPLPLAKWGWKGKEAKTSARRELWEYHWERLDRLRWKDRIVCILSYDTRGRESIYCIPVLINTNILSIFQVGRGGGRGKR